MREFIVDLIKKIGADDCMGLAGEMAYNLILSMIPMMIFLISLLGLVGGQQETYPLVISFINRIAPLQTTHLLTETMNTIIEGSSTNITLIGLLGMMLSASVAGNVVVKGLQRAYGISAKAFPFWYSPMLSILIVLSFGFLTVLATYLIVFGNVLINWFNHYLYLDAIMTFLIAGLRWLVAVAAMWWGVAFTYRLILKPKTDDATWKKALAGSLFFVASWLLMSFLFGFYVDRIQYLNPIYGTLGALIILVTWLYYSSLVFFVGAEITALIVLNKQQATEFSQVEVAS